MTTKILTLDDLAKRLLICTETARRLANQGLIPAVKVGGRWRVDSRALDSFMGVQAAHICGARARQTAA